MATDVPPRTGAPAGKIPARGGSSVPPRGGRKPQGQTASFRARKRRRQQLIGGGVVAAVIVVVAVLVAVAASGGSGGSGSANSAPVTSAQLASLQSITPAQMAQAESALKDTVSNPPILVNGPALTADGKPQVVYLGAEYCPYCGGERWSMVMALSQFGTFTNLHSTTSAANDTPASIPTFTFVGSSYSSPYLTFTPRETEDRNRKPLQTAEPALVALETKYDAPPYVSGGGIPFIDIGNYSVQDGLSYKDGATLAGQSFASVLSQVSGQSSQVGGEIAATAGVLVSNLCKLTGGHSLNGDAACKAFPAPVTRAPANA